MSSGGALARAAERAAQRKDFLGWDLAHLRSFTTTDRHALALQLKLDDANLTRLELCRSPRRDRGFRSDIEVIAEFVGVEARELAATVRLADALGTLHTAPASIPEAV